MGCGVDTIAFVEGPNADEVTADRLGARIVFNHNDSDANSSPDFKGYELYYKFYDDSVTDPWVDDQNTILADPVATGTSRLTNRSYRRVIRGNDQAGIPSIIVTSKTTEYAITLDFFESASDPTDTEATASWNDGSPASIDLRRNTDATTPGTFKSFFGAFSTSDDDADSTIVNAKSSGNLGIAIYALGYGIEGGSFRQLYSEPVFLGYLVLQ